jgi:iron complex outermembrane receptor protein
MKVSTSLIRHAATIALSGSTFALLANGQAFAQSTAAAGASHTEEIIVTAQRRSERLESVPMTVTALSPEKLEKSGIVVFDDIDKVTPGVQVSRFGVFTQPSIRGINTKVIGPGQENDIATYIDGFYQADQLALSGDLVNLADVQVLKGPQGALYGRNANGGAILINTLDPSDTFVGKFTATYGRFNDKGITGYLSLPLTQKVAFNISANFRDNDGYIKDITGIYPGTTIAYGRPFQNDKISAPYKSWSVRTKLKLDVSDNVRVLLGYTHKYFTDSSANDWNFTRYYAIPPDPGTGPYVVSRSVPNIYNNSTDTATAKISIDTGIGTITSKTQYNHLQVLFLNDYDNSKADIVQSGAHWPRITWEQNVDYNITAIDRLNLVIGANYLHDKASSDPSFTILNGAIANSYPIAILTTSAYAIYGDGTYNLFDHFYVSAGLRYSSEHKQIDSYFGCCQLAGQPIFPGQPDTKTFANLSPRATLRYEFTEGTDVYASFSRGFKSGTFDGLVTLPQSQKLPPIRPETVSAWEVGFKTQKDKIHFNIAAFLYNLKNLQVSNDLQINGVLITTTENAAAARDYGGEANITYAASDALNLSAGVAYTHDRYTNYPAATAALIVGGFIVQGAQDFSGVRVARAPDWTFNVGADYTVPVGQGSLVFSGNVYYTSSYTINSESYDPVTRKPLFGQVPYALVNGQVTWNLPDNHTSLSIYANNITNTKYKIYYNYSPLGAYYAYGQPTMYGVKAAYNF